MSTHLQTLNTYGDVDYQLSPRVDPAGCANGCLRGRYIDGLCKKCSDLAEYRRQLAAERGERG